MNAVVDIVKKNNQLRLLALLPIVVLLSACNFSLAADVTPPPGYQPPPQETQPAPVSGPLYPLTPPDPTAGEAIYIEKCAPCHGPQGLGDGERAAQLPNPVTAIGDPEIARRAAPEDWYRIVSEGNLERFMPPFPSLSASERWDVIAYVYGLSQPPEQISLGEELFRQNCAGCHGEQGGGEGVQAAGLSPAPVNFTNQPYMARQSAEELFQAVSLGVPPEMPAYQDQLSEEERWALTGYLRSLSFSPADLPAQAGVEAPGAGTPQPAESEAGGQAQEVPPGHPPIDGAEDAASDDPSAADGISTVDGVVFNASGGEVPEGLEVTLLGFDGMQTALTLTTTVQPDGSFAFEDVEAPAGRVFLATTEYSGAQYGSEIATAQGDQAAISLPIQIYETSTDTSALSVDRLHMFFELVDEQTLRVIELYVASNPTQNTIAAPEPGQPVIEYQLPAGAANLEFQNGVLGGRYVETETGFGDTASIIPGQSSYQALFGFELPFDGEQALAQPMPLPADAVVLLLPEGSLTVEGSGLEDLGPQDVQGTVYHMYNAGALEAGETLELTLSRTRPNILSTLLTGGSSTGLVIGIAAFGLALIGSGALLYRRSRRVEQEKALLEPYGLDEAPLLDDDFDAQGLDAAAFAEADSEALMDAILTLDDLYQDGELPEEAYRQRREALKARLKALLDG